MVTLVLHHAWRSSASRRVRLCLEEKGLAYEGHLVDLSKMEQHSPEYLKINPNGVIPTLIHEGRALYESGTICEYLDEVFPEPPLRPADAWGRATMRNWIRYADERIGNLIVFNWRHGLQQIAQKWSDEELAERLKKIPSKERREAWLRVARRRALLHRRHRARAVREAHRRGDRARGDDRRQVPARRCVVERDHRTARVPARADRTVHRSVAGRRLPTIFHASGSASIASS